MMYDRNGNPMFIRISVGAIAVLVSVSWMLLRRRKKKKVPEGHALI